MLISFAVTAKLICVFVFAYAKTWFSHNAAHIDPVESQFVESQFDTVKLGLTGVYISLLNSASQHSVGICRTR